MCTHDSIKACQRETPNSNLRAYSQLKLPKDHPTGPTVKTCRSPQNRQFRSNLQGHLPIGLGCFNRFTLFEIQNDPTYIKTLVFKMVFKWWFSGCLMNVQMFFGRCLNETLSKTYKTKTDSKWLTLSRAMTNPYHCTWPMIFNSLLCIWRRSLSELIID